LYLKSLTLKGFKSFASSTTLQLEPGITCIVGPNGSGKSNVVDALAWVMGEQGAKSLRGGKMEDVIFAGTSGRPPLGRAEVLLTIDNSDGALPIEYAEVTISRTMFRSGGSEYAINGTSCRLLDVQELLSDSGIGREMHVIVGQGQLDTILHATPEDRRGFIEEAAGVLKHRKRKEKALRKLDAMQANLARVQDLTDELRRQLKPLGRQAAVARRADVSVRSVFQHFGDVESLFVTVMDAIRQDIVVPPPTLNTRPLADRVASVVQNLAEVFDKIVPLRVAAGQFVGHPALIERGNTFKLELRESTFETFAPEFANLGEQAREELADAIGAALSLDAWIVLRRRDNLSFERAAAVWRMTLTALLAHRFASVAAE
jgi:AcrR family transcriptional regulator